MHTETQAQIDIFCNGEKVATATLEDGMILDLDAPLSGNYAEHSMICNQIELAILSGEEVVIVGPTLQSHYTWIIERISHGR